MEEQLVDFFGEAPEEDMELDVEKPDVYYRMIFHAVCQYFGLLSKSRLACLPLVCFLLNLAIAKTGFAGVKSRQTCRTQVKKRSRNSAFHEPPQRLSVYLMQRYD